MWEQTAIISLHSINWLVLITEMGCVYCVVRTAFICNPSNPSGYYMYSQFNIHNSTFCPHSVRTYLTVLCESENKQRLFPYTALTDWFP